MKSNHMNMTTEYKDEIYDFLSKNKKRFIYKKDSLEQINSMNLLLTEICNLHFNSFDDCFLFLTEHWDKKCKNTNCSNVRKIGCLFPNRNDFIEISRRKYGIFKFCDDVRCNYSSISNRQRGENNTSHRMSDETFKSMCLKNSIKMKLNIKEGRFIPNITNSWAKSRCEIEFYRNDILIKMKTRSTWDAYFQIHNPNLIYEKVIIQYKYNKQEHNYIVDFVDFENKIIYEIKPTSNLDNKKNISKIKYAKKWCKTNGYRFLIIKESWFKKNYNEQNIVGQPCEEKMRRNLKQFL